ncbi:unnamed protein product, partial [Heterosigma akashiwo]
EDAELAGAGLRAAPLQAHAAVRHGRDRRSAGLQERVHRGQLHQGADQERPVHHHLPAQQHVRARRPPGRHLQGGQRDQQRDHQPQGRRRPGPAAAGRPSSCTGRRERRAYDEEDQQQTKEKQKGVRSRGTDRSHKSPRTDCLKNDWIIMRVYM